MNFEPNLTTSVPACGGVGCLGHVDVQNTLVENSLVGLESDLGSSRHGVCLSACSAGVAAEAGTVDIGNLNSLELSSEMSDREHLPVRWTDSYLCDEHRSNHQYFVHPQVIGGKCLISTLKKCMHWAGHVQCAEAREVRERTKAVSKVFHNMAAEEQIL